MTGSDSQSNLNSMRNLKFFILTASSLALVACQSPSTLDGDKTMPANPVVPVEKNILDGDRLSALEFRVGTLETQISDAQPTLKKVEVIENHFKALSLELDRIDATYAPNRPLNVTKPDAIKSVPKSESVKITKVTTPIEKPAPKPPEKEKSPSPATMKASESVAAVTSVRIGEQKGEVTRIVLDTTKRTEMRYDLDNGEGLLVIDLPGNQWKATESLTLKSSPMVKSFRANTDKNGSHLVLQLKQSAKVLSTARLNPSGSYGHRVYLDLVPFK